MNVEGIMTRYGLGAEIAGILVESYGVSGNPREYGFYRQKMFDAGLTTCGLENALNCLDVIFKK